MKAVQKNISTLHKNIWCSILLKTEEVKPVLNEEEQLYKTTPCVALKKLLGTKMASVFGSWCIMHDEDNEI